MNLAQLHDLIACSRDPWYFLTTHVVTQDPARGELRFPEFEYLRDLIAACEEQRFLLVPKSRQMMVTWTIVAYTLWRALFRGPGDFLLLSRNERCAEELIARVRFMIERLPDHLRPRLTANSKEELAFGKLGSRILSLPASPNGPRMYSPAGVFWDEMAFTPYDEAIWTALKPALDSGGRFIGVSSSGGALNLFAKFVVHDSSFIPHPSSLFHIHRIHYSMHPDRQSAEWKAQAGLGLSAARWKQEQEISFESCDDLVYSEFDPVKHILREPWRVRPTWEIYRAIDFGFHHPFVLWIQRTEEGDFVVFDEWSAENRTTEQLYFAVRGFDFSHNISEHHVLWTACDPAGAAVQDSGLSPVDTLRRMGMKLRYRSSRIAAGIELVKRELQDSNGKCRLRISPNCHRLIADFKQYRWDAGTDLPIKDGLCDHSMDTLRYFFVNYYGMDDTERAFSPRFASMHR